MAGSREQAAWDVGADFLADLVKVKVFLDIYEVKSEYVSETRAMEGNFGGCGAAAPRNFF